MALGLVLMTGLGSIPVLLLLWGLGSILGVIYIAEALERTGGLAPTTFGGAFWLAVVFLGLLVALEVGTWFSREEAPEGRGGCLTALLTRPAFAAVLLVLPTLLLVQWDLRGTDVPDVVTTTALLCVLGYGLFVLPLAFVASAVRLARWLWRLGSGSSFRSGLVAGSATVLGALLPTCLVCAPPEHPARRAPEAAAARLGDGREILGEVVEREGLLDGTLAALTHAAEFIPGKSGPWTLPPALLPPAPRGPSIGECVEKLLTSRTGRAEVEKAILHLQNRWRADYDTANAVAYATVFSVCRAHEKKPKNDLEQYYRGAIDRNYCKSYERNPLRQCDLTDRIDAHCERGPFSASYGDPAELDVVMDLRARLCRLPRDEDREVVRRFMEGETSVQIGVALGLSDATVRKRLERAIERMRDP